jgi:hypothetical protein
MINILREKNVLRNSLVIVCSDHGELLGEYGKVQHGTFLYDELLKVPCFVRIPEDTCADFSGFSDGNQYLSLTSLRELIHLVSKRREIDPKLLLSDFVFSGSYGVHIKVDMSRLNREELKTYYDIEKYRIAIYYKNFKGIFNVTDWKFEEIKSYDPNIEVTEDVVKHMKKEVLKFLKTATVAKVPKIKL